jgi:lipopolysaccharide cholinephosphotransferase
MYQDVAVVCEKYNLCIMLSYGSVIGAIRHKGFIPWDDDMDVMMPRKDYNMLIKIFNKELGDKYYLSVPRNGDDSRTLFMTINKKNTLMVGVTDFIVKNMKGIKLDVFSIEDVPNNFLMQKIKGSLAVLFRFIVLSINFYLDKNHKQYYSSSVQAKLWFYFRYFIGASVSIFSRRYLYDKYDSFVSSSKGNKFVTICTSGRGGYLKEILPRDVFFPVSKGIFEGIEVNLPNKPDVYLRREYGDYMRIPPPEKRERHYFIDFSLDTTRYC